MFIVSTFNTKYWNFIIISCMTEISLLQFEHYGHLVLLNIILSTHRATAPYYTEFINN